MRLAERRPQAVGLVRNEDQMDVIVHQAPGEATHLRPKATLAQEPKIEPPVLVTEEDRLLPVPALRHMMRDAGDHDAGKAGHISVWLPHRQTGFNSVLCLRNSRHYSPHKFLSNFLGRDMCRRGDTR